MKRNNPVKRKKKDLYFIKLLISLFLLLIVLSYISLYLIQHFYSTQFFALGNQDKKIYFLNASTLKNMYDKNNMDYSMYEKNIGNFKKLCINNGYSVKDINSTGLDKVNKNSILIVLDMLTLSNKELDSIDSFVSKGGKIIFNFTSGFLNDSQSYRDDNLVKRITNFTHKGYKKYKSFLSTRMASPITQYLKDGSGLGFALYDPIPWYMTPLEADAYSTGWTQTEHVKPKNSEERLTMQQSALIWHGNKGLGKWVYFSFPSYVFMESALEEYEKLFKGMMAYLENKINIVPYPYIDAKNAVFVSEDTEYKYENLKHFSDAAQKYQFPVTAFCVASLAQKYQNITKNAAKNTYMELGSHSHTHKKIVGESRDVYKKEIFDSKEALERLSDDDIIGFRPPREEMDDLMIEVLQDENYKYILGKSENRLAPYFKKDIMILPRHGMDDYSFLVQLDWSSEEIFKEMKKQVDTITKLDGLYTLSTHSHLMAFGSNIKIIEDFFAYVNTQSYMTPMNGKMIYDRVFKSSHLTLESSISQKAAIVTISNNNTKVVKNLHYEIFLDPGFKIKNVESEIMGIETKLIKQEKSKYLLIVKSINPKSQVVLFLNYVKDN